MQENVDATDIRYFSPTNFIMKGWSGWEVHIRVHSQIILDLGTKNYIMID